MKSKNLLVLLLLLPALALTLAGCGASVQAGPAPNMSAAMKIREGFKAAASKTGGAEAGPELKRLEGWASIRGRFVVDGTIPSPTALTIDKDQDVCGAHPLFNEAIVVKDKALANVVVFVRTPKIPIHDDYKKPGDPVIVDNKGCRFEPHVSHIAVGQTLRIQNSDKVAHNTNIAGKKLQANPLIPADGTQEFKMEDVEAVPVSLSCNIHPWMKGRLVVTANPYCSVSKGDGSFELKNVPAGELELQIWQEAADNLDVSNPKLQKTGPGRYKISLQPKEELNLNDIVVPAAALKAG